MLAEIAPAGDRAVDPERAAGLQAARHRRSRGRELHRARAARSPRSWSSSRRAPGAPSRSRSSRSRCASSRRPPRRSTTSRAALLRRRGASGSRELAGLPLAEAHGALRRHVGIVFDACHQAVEYEDMARVARRSCATPACRSSSSSRPRPCTSPRSPRRRSTLLERYAETVYLTQTFERRDGEITALPQPRGRDRGLRRRPGREREWRVHFHVPVFLDDLGPFRTHALRDRGGARATTASTTSRASSRSRPTRGTCCRTSSRPATSSSTSWRELEWVRGQLA